MPRAILAALLLVLAAPAIASAATVRAERRTIEGYSKTGSYRVVELDVLFQAAPGEANVLTTTVEGATDGARTVRFRDTAVPVQAGAGCSQVDDHEVMCASSDIKLARPRVETGDADDRILAAWAEVDAGAGADRVEATDSFVSGGDGDDVLSGGEVLKGDAGNDTLTVGGERAHVRGGSGDDRLVGGPDADSLNGDGGRDVLIGGPGEDALADGDGGRTDPGAPTAPVDADVLDGGKGADHVSYFEHPAGVTVDLGRPGPAGQPGEGDRLTQIEGVTGTAYADRLAGDASPNELRGHQGNDHLSGRQGDDRLFTGPGRTRIEGGAGDDEIAAGSGPDRLEGGSGDDRLQGNSGSDRIAAGQGADTVEGGGGVDTIDLGPGSDATDTTGDFLIDRVACGAGRDRAESDPGDRFSGCERVRRQPFATLLPDLARRPEISVVSGRTSLSVDCVDQLQLSCRGEASIADEAGVVWRGRFGCRRPWPPDDSACTGTVPVRGGRLAKRVVTRLRRVRRLDVTVTFVIAPGLGRGGIPVREPARLVLERRG